MNRFKMGYTNNAKKSLQAQIQGVEGPPGPMGPAGPTGPSGPAGAGFTLSANGNFDIQSKKLENVLPGTSNSDVVVKSQVVVVDGGGNLDLKEQANILNSKQRNLSELKTHYDSLVSFEEVKQNFLSLKETFPIRATLDMNSNRILKLKDPTDGKEPATKDYADTKLALTGGTMTGSINMGTHEITNLANPTGNSNAATKSYVDGVDTSVRTKISQEVASIQTALNTKVDIGNMIDMQGSRITNLGAPAGFTDAATTQFVQNLLGNYLNLRGGTMSGQIDMANNKIVGLNTQKMLQMQQQENM